MATHTHSARANGQAAGIPTARNVDHVGFTVPDLDAALRFFVDVLGAELLYTAGPIDDPRGDSLRAHFDVGPRSSYRLALLRLGPTLNVELMQFDAPDQRRIMPRESDWGAAHLAFYVDDLAAAAAYLQARGVRLLAPNAHRDGPSAGQEMRYALTPWGLPLELIRRPTRLPYEDDTAARAYGPAPSWT